MASSATRRGARRTSIQGDCDVLICGASFAGLAVARTLAGCGARVMVLDRFEIGERQSSACAIPTDWLTALGLDDSELQRFEQILLHTPYRSATWQMPFSFSTFDYRRLCDQLWLQSGLPDDTFQTAAVSGRHGDVVVTDRGELRAPLVVDALGWRRVLAPGDPIQPPRATLSRGLEVHPAGSDEAMQLWIDKRILRSGYAWCFPAGDELRVGAGSFRPADHVREPTLRLADQLGLQPDGFQGNWIPHRLRAAAEDGVFFAGDSAGHCLPLTAEGIRTALYFGVACGRELRAVLQGEKSAAAARSDYAAFSESHRRKYEWLLRVQKAVGQLTITPAIAATAALLEGRRFMRWSFGHYYNIANPGFVGEPLRRAAAMTR